MWYLILELLILVPQPGCAFETAFEKGALDAESASYGANLDRFCRFATESQRDEFKKSYELGRTHGPTLKKARIVEVPKSLLELERSLREARTHLATQDALEHLSQVPGKEPSAVDLPALIKRLDALEAENKKLSEQLSPSP